MKRFHPLWISLAAASFSAPALAVDASAGLYGDFRYAVVNSKTEGSGQDTDAVGTNSHIGVRLAAGEGDYTATVIYERTLGTDASSVGDSVRQAFVSVGTPFGTIGFGRAATAYKLSGQKLDPFYNTALGTINGEAFGNGLGLALGPSFGLSALTSDTVSQGFVDNQISYTAPAIYGVTLNAAVFLDERNRDNGEQHDFGVGAEYNNGGITAGVQYLDIRSTPLSGNADANFAAGLPVATKATRVYAGYNTEGWGVGVSWEPLDLKDGGVDRDYYFLSGHLQVLPQTRVAASYGYVEGTAFEGDSLSLGVFHDLFPGFEVYAAARYTDRDVTTLNPNGNSSRDFTVGVSYRFSVSRSGSL